MSRYWECIYIVVRKNTRFLVRDYIISTTLPTNKDIGHYWSSLFDDKIVSLSCVQVDTPVDKGVQLIPLAQEYHTASI